MSETNNRRLGSINILRNRQAILAAAAAMAWANAALATSTTLYFDVNGAAAGFESGTTQTSGTWDEATTADWNSASGSTTTNAPGTWTQNGTDFNTAVFQAAMLPIVSGTVDVGGMTFASGGTTVNYVAGTSPFINIGGVGSTLALSTPSGTSKNIIYAPIEGAGNISFTYGAGSTMDLSGDLTNFTGNIYVNNANSSRTGTSPTIAALQLASSPAGSGSIYLDNGASLGCDNIQSYTPQGGSLITTAATFTLNNPVVLNYGGTSAAPVAGGRSYIYASNGLDSFTENTNTSSPSYNTITNDSNALVLNASTSVALAGTARIMTYAGVISSGAGVTSGLGIGNSASSGGRGTVILDAVDSYNGPTLITEASNDGLVQLGVDNAIPATSSVTFGTSTNTVAPLDLNGHNLTIAGLATGTTVQASNGTYGVSDGNIYNTSLQNGAAQGNTYAVAAQSVGSPNTVTLTIAGPGSYVYQGDIGCTNFDVQPYDNEQPYVINSGGTYASNVNFGQNINLVINGGTQTLQPGVNQLYGEELTGSVTVNGGTLVLARGGGNVTVGTLTYTSQATYTGGPGVGVPAAYYTLSGGINQAAVNVDVKAGATLASGPSDSTHFTGGASGTITLEAGTSSSSRGGNLVVGGAGTTGAFSTNNVTANAYSTMSFDIASSSNFDYLSLIGTLTLDAGPHYIDVNIPSGDILTPGTYQIIASDNYFNETGGSGNFQLETTGVPAGDTLSLVDGGSGSASATYGFLNLVVQAPLLQWDPDSTGPNVTEGPGTWQNGSPFYNFTPGVLADQGWVNQTAPTANYTPPEVLFGNNATMSGGQVTLGMPIVVYGLLGFGPIANNGQYTLGAPGDTTDTLSLGGGISVNTATTAGNSATINAPIILLANQTWEVDSGQFLAVNGTVNGNYAVTKTGSGTVDLYATTGSIGGGLTIDAGYVLLGGTGSMGSTGTLTLNGGDLEFQGSGTFSNPITYNSGSIGIAQNATNGENATTSSLTVNITSAISNPTGNVETIGTGVLNFSGGINAGTFTTVTGAYSFTNSSGGTTTVTAIDNISGTNTFGTINQTGGALNLNGTDTIGAINITGGVLTAASQAALGPSTAYPVITLTTGNASGLNVTALSTLANSVLGTASGSTDINFVDEVFYNGTNTNNNGTVPTGLTITGAIGGTGDIHFQAVATNTPATGTVDAALVFDDTGTHSGGANLFSGPTGTIVDIVIPANAPLTSGTATGLGTVTNTFDQSAVFEVDAASVTTGAFRSDAGSGSTAAINNITVTKTGSGTLIAGGSAGGDGTGNTLVIANGNVQQNTASSIGGSGSATVPLWSIVLNANTNATPDSLTFNFTGTRYGGAYTLNTNTSLVRTDNFIGETDILADSATDVITVNGTATIEDQGVEGTGTNIVGSSNLFTIQNPVVVSTGATLNLQQDNPQFNGTTGGNDSSYLLGIRGPSSATTLYDTLTISAGATVADTGPGQVRFGRTNSGGLPIIGEGTPGADAVLKLSTTVGGVVYNDVYMTDSATVSQSAGDIDTVFIVDGSGNAGLRIEAPMVATYEDPTAASANSNNAEGTTGLFGINTTETASGTVPTGFYGSIGNAYTVLSPNRAAALAASYSYNTGTTTYSQAGTLTLAANDAGSVTGTITVGPTSQSNVTLALDNTSGSGGTHIYQINPASPDGGSFANFAGLTVERTYGAGAAVTAQLLGNTLVPSLSITGGARVDITNQALVVDPGASGTAPAAAIEAYLKNAYDKGAWDGPGIGTSSPTVTNGMSIGYASNAELGDLYNSSNLFGGSSGQSVSANAELVRYTYLGDLNLDGEVTGSDLNTLMANIGTSNPDWADGDLNYDNVINADDFSLFQLGAAEYAAHGQFNSAVPEPATISMLALGAGALLRRRRRH